MNERPSHVETAWLALAHRVLETIAAIRVRHAVDTSIGTEPGGNAMNPWIATSNRLPQEGDLLQFAIEQRDIVLYGIYSSCMFKSRWSCYSPADVTEWRLLDICPADHAQRPNARADEAGCPQASARAA